MEIDLLALPPPPPQKKKSGGDAVKEEIDWSGVYFDNTKRSVFCVFVFSPLSLPSTLEQREKKDRNTRKVKRCMLVIQTGEVHPPPSPFRPGTIIFDEPQTDRQTSYRSYKGSEMRFNNLNLVRISSAVGEKREENAFQTK